MTEFLVRVLAELPPSSASDCLRALAAGQRPILLDDAIQGAQLLAWGPDQLCQGRLVQGDCRVGRAVRPGPASRWPLADHDPTLRLTEAWRAENWQLEEEFPLTPGWMGFFGFECGHAYLPFPWPQHRERDLPDYAWGRFRFAVLFEADRTRILHAVNLSEEADEQRRGQQYVMEVQELLLAARELEPASAPMTKFSNRTRAESFQQSVRELRSKIGAGELFQANLSHELVAHLDVDPRSLYSATRIAQPTGMSAYMELSDDQALLSWSPEVFLSARGSEIQTRPIKGTARRGQDSAEDQDLAQGLENSEKERAELTMIVDMARNDLGSIAIAGSVEVCSAGDVEAYPTLWHRTARVQARLRDGLGLRDLMAACFPPASVTGAPKVRALQAIVEAEGEARGAYCGSLGYWLPGLERGEFSVLIRTATVHARELRLRVGAGIVWDSDAEAEWQETLLKARYLEQQHEQTSL